MQKFYAGSHVTVVRAAQPGDDGYDAKKDQVLIEMPDKTRKLVLRGDITSTEG